jgi:hydrogenase expression/formation protein HypC
MQVIRSGEVTALCRSRNGDETVNMLMVGSQPEGTWVLSFLGWAREILTEDHAREIDLALDGLELIMNGAEDVDIDHHFAGIHLEVQT